MARFETLLAVGVWLILAIAGQAEDAPDDRPAMRWDHLPTANVWTDAGLAAVQDIGTGLTQTVPADIDSYCPAYPSNDQAGRRAFWVGLASALAKHESTWRPAAVGGSGRWFGLLQISPGTARSYGCAARNGEALMHGPANLSCAIRIWSRTVTRDGVISAGMRGIAADWGPFHSRIKRQDIMKWTRQQEYCQASTRPTNRPE